jgi:hypothetical protein
MLMEMSTKNTLQKMDYKACLGKTGEVSKYQLAFVPGSIRFMHKFDPIPSMGFQYGQWSHGTQYGMLLYDMSGCNSGTPACANGMVESTGHPGLLHEAGPYAGQPEALPHYLCESGVQPSGKMFQCNSEYYSYTNMFNPVPCVEVLIAQMYLYDKHMGDAHYPGDALSPFIPHEDFDYCSSSYTATVEMYYSVYLAADIGSIPAMETDLQDIVDSNGNYDETELLMAVGYWAAWGLIYIHMAYPNYPLCTSGNNDFYGDAFQMRGPVGPKSNGVADSLSAVKKAIPTFDDMVSWYEDADGGAAEGPPRGMEPPKGRGK